MNKFLTISFPYPCRGDVLREDHSDSLQLSLKKILSCGVTTLSYEFPGSSLDSLHPEGHSSFGLDPGLVTFETHY